MDTGTGGAAGDGGWVRPGGDPASGAPAVPGTVLLRSLGAGGHGQVWLATDLVSGDQVAIKVCRPAGDGVTDATGDATGDGAGDATGDAAGDGVAAARLAREVALLRRIDHPHVVRLRRVVDLPDGAGRALVMDHAVGGSLADLVDLRGSLPAGEASTVLVPLARTLGDLHERGLVHGDLTPSNVLFTAEGRPMIADLGCAVILGEATGETWGSPDYCDPARSGAPGPADDVYALGALLRFVLTGDPRPAADPIAADEPARGLLALADLCTAAEPDRRPDPRQLARTVFSLSPPAPVRLVGAAPAPPPAPAPPAATGPAAAPPAAAGPAAAGPAATPAAAARPVVRLRVAHQVPPPAGAAPSSGGSAWTRAPRGTSGSTTPSRGPGDATSSVSVPRTATDLGLSRRATRQMRGRPGPASGPPRRSGRAVPAAGRRMITGVSVTALLLALVVGGWWVIRLRPASGAPADPVAVPVAVPVPVTASTVTPTVTVPASAAPTVEPTTSSTTGAPAVERETPQAAVLRLAADRADAFRQASTGPLATVDEPGSPALGADVAFVQRLRSSGVRLEGLSFDVRQVSARRNPDGTASVTASVTTSAHSQVGPTGANRVPQADPRTVRLILVPAVDRQHWLIRSVT